MDILSMTRYLYQLNLTKRIYISRNNAFIKQLYEKAIAKPVAQISVFFQMLKNLYYYTLRNAFYLVAKHPYLKKMMEECEKECDEKPINPLKKAALLVGINYNGTSSQLNGCENDIFATKKVLIDFYGFKEEDIVVLAESIKGKQPTRDNIMNGLNWLVQKSKEGYGSIWFQYSGHGFYLKDQDGDEADGMDECICTSDNYPIMDDEFRANFVNRMRKETKVFCLMDCCHSGSMLDLRYKYKRDLNALVLENKTNPDCNIVALSGCRDDQTSADAYFKSGWAGALTQSFLTVLEKYNYHPKLFDMVKKIHEELAKNKFTQLPQLTTSKEMNAQKVFSL